MSKKSDTDRLAYGAGDQLLIWDENGKPFVPNRPRRVAQRYMERQAARQPKPDTSGQED